MTLEVAGNFVAGNSLKIDKGSNTFSLVVGGNIDLGNSFIGSLDMQAGGNIKSGNSFSLVGQARAGGDIDLGNSTNVTGNLTAGGRLKIGGGSVNGICTPSHPLCSGVDPNPQLTCASDSFSSANLDPALWNAMAIKGSFIPQVVDVSGSKRLRLTTASGNQSTMVQLKKWFPGAGNKISVEFDYYVYGGNGADGMTVVFSDANVAPAAGGFGGSLGYAQKSGGDNGFSGGWLGVGIDEFGNFPNASEGRQGYPAGWVPPAGANVAAGAKKNNVSIRGSGSGSTGYVLLANTGTLATPIWQNSNASSTRQRFRVVIDHSDNVHAYVSVERDVTGTGNSYVTVVQKFDVKAANSGQAKVPDNFLVSFAGSTGGSYNIHELSLANVCANQMTDPLGAVNAESFDCVETGVNTPWVAGARKPLYTKLVNTNFKLDVAALKADGSLESNFVRAGGNTRYINLELVDISSASASCANDGTSVTSSIVSFASGAFSGVAGRVLSPNISISSPYTKLRCRIRECTTSSCTAFTAQPAACSTDSFAVRPAAFTVTANLGGAKLQAGRSFTMSANSGGGARYTGMPILNLSKVMDHNGVLAGALSGSFAAAVNGTATGNFNYHDVGTISLQQDAVTESDFTAIDNSMGDCVAGSTSNTPSSGKVGCSVGSSAAGPFGRFYPDHFSYVASLTPACNGFVYMDQPALGVSYSLEARSSNESITSRYTAGYSFLGVPVISGVSGGSAVDLGRLVPAIPTPAWNGGRVSFSQPAAMFARTTSPDGPYESFALQAAVSSEPDSVTISGSSISNAIKIRHGRLRLSNRYGSEKADISLPIRAEYWSGKSWAINAADNCTALAANNFFLSGGISSNSAASAVSLSSGVGNLILLKPNPQAVGSIDVAVNLGASGPDQSCLATHGGTTAQKPWLRSRNGNCATSYDRDPAARATFGIFSPESQKNVHVRELF